MTFEEKLLGLGVLAAAVVGIAIWAKGTKEVGLAVGGAAVDMADGIVTGTVLGIGDAIGIPRTDLKECEKAKAEGRTWDAFFACPAGNFTKYWWNK